MQVLPVASGKGGVGKSLVAANLSIALAQAGKKVIIADLDLGGSNLHTVLGMRAPAAGIGTFLNRKNVDFSEIVLSTDYKNLEFIPGDAEIPGIANLKSHQKRTLTRKMLELEADYLVLDLGSGTTFNTLDFFLLSSRGIIVTVPSLTAILNAYLFLKNAVFRLIDHSFPAKGPAGEYLKSLRENGSGLQRAYIPQILPELRVRDPEGYEKFIRQRDAFQPLLIMNMLEDPKDGVKAGKIRRSCIHYLGIDLDHLGVIYRDTLQDAALSSGLPIIVYKPQSVLAQAIMRIADKVMEQTPGDFPPADIDDVDENYLTADMEAEIDFETKIQYIQDLLHSGALSEGDLFETIRAQQFEIAGLRKENNFLKSKIVKASEAVFSQ
ncbi:MAG: P-loop NTPase [Spirochaetales bacterium]|jgi:flagellar biosynthesis protein FlhG|nr:P-loop NTPase [Spirochaetales bacterium]